MAFKCPGQQEWVYIRIRVGIYELIIVPTVPKLMFRGCGCWEFIKGGYSINIHPMNRHCEEPGFSFPTLEERLPNGY